MKKTILFLFVFFYPFQVHAGHIEELKVTNGVLSREFEKNNNFYSVDLYEGEDTLEYTYKLENQEDTLEEEKEKNKVILTVNSGSDKEEYVIYINHKEETPVLKEVFEEQEEQRIIPHLKLYVIGGCFILILILFKILK